MRVIVWMLRRMHAATTYWFFILASEIRCLVQQRRFSASRRASSTLCIRNKNTPEVLKLPTKSKNEKIWIHAYICQVDKRKPVSFSTNTVHSA